MRAAHAPLTTYVPREQRRRAFLPEVEAELVLLEDAVNDLEARGLLDDGLLAWDLIEQLYMHLECGAQLDATRYVYGLRGLEQVLWRLTWPPTKVSLP